MKIRVLVTREATNRIKTFDLLKDMGFSPVLCPFIEIEHVPFKLGGDTPDYIIITSINAAKALSFMNVPCFVVGQKSAIYLEKNGIKVAGVFRDSEALLAKLSALANLKFLYLSGDHIATDIPKVLEKAGHKVTRKIVYKSKIVENISANILDGIDVVTFYSPRTALAFVSFVSHNALHDKLKRITAVCLSPKIAANLNDFAFKEVLIAPEPNETALLKLLKNKCSNLA